MTYMKNPEKAKDMRKQIMQLKNLPTNEDEIKNLEVLPKEKLIEVSKVVSEI